MEKSINYGSVHNARQAFFASISLDSSLSTCLMEVRKHVSVKGKPGVSCLNLKVLGEILHNLFLGGLYSILLHRLCIVPRPALVLINFSHLTQLTFDTSSKQYITTSSQTMYSRYRSIFKADTTAAYCAEKNKFKCRNINKENKKGKTGKSACILTSHRQMTSYCTQL